MRKLLKTIARKIAPALVPAEPMRVSEAAIDAMVKSGKPAAATGERAREKELRRLFNHYT